MGPCITLIFALLGWAIIPFGEGLAIFDYELGIFFALAVSSLGSYGILISGWAANSKYAFMGAIRSTAQLLSYELVFSSIILILILFSGSFSLTYIVECQQIIWNMFPLLPITLMFFIAILAETNRPPFDLPEAESELVAGLCGMRFTLYCWSWKTLSWVLGLIQYKSNDLTSVIGIVSNLYWKRTKYVNKLMNPFKGSLYHEIVIIYHDILQLFTHFYAWTSKTRDPAERLTPCIGYIWVKRNKMFLKESGNSLFRYNYYNYTNSIGETITRSGNWKITALEKGRKGDIFSLNLVRSFSTCSPTTKNELFKINTQIENEINHYAGISFMKLNNINQNNDGKFRKVSSFLFDSYFLIGVYNKLYNLNIINYNIELDWFDNIVVKLKNGSYNPIKRKNNYMINKEMFIQKQLNCDIDIDNNEYRDFIISEGISIILTHIFKVRKVVSLNSFSSFEYEVPSINCMHNCLFKLKTEWNDINWLIVFNFDNKFKPIHRKIIFSELENYIDDQRLYDIMNKLFNKGIMDLSYNKTFDKYSLFNYDSLSYTLINIFFQRFDKEIYRIKNKLFNEWKNVYNIRFIRYFNEILIGIKGPKVEALKIMKKLENFLESDLHLNIIEKNNNIIHIHSDNIFCFNVNISSVIKKSKLLTDKNSRIIQQKKKGIRLRKIKAMKNNKEFQTINEKSQTNIVKKNKKIVNKTYIHTELNGVKSNIEKNRLNELIIEKIGRSIKLSMDTNKIKKMLINTGLLNKRCKPIALTKILNWDSYFIISFYKQISKLIWNTFSVCDNYKDIVTIINYHIKLSLLHTLAAKHKSSKKKIINELYPDLVVKRKDNFIKFYSKEELLKSKRSIFSKNNNQFFGKDYNWNEDNIDFFNMLKQQRLGFNSNYSSFYNISSKSETEENLYFNENKRILTFNYAKLGLGNEKINNRISLLNIKGKRRFSTSMINNENNIIFHMNNKIRKYELETSYLLNMYPYFLENIKNNNGSFWSGENKEDLNDKEFKEWLSGFVDAEGLFFIKLRKNLQNCSFIFELHLHIDDMPVLKYIKNRLGLGNLRTYKNAVWYYINKIDEIEKFISIFNEYPLWTHKQLDYKAFKLAFVNRRNYSFVVEIKNTMNSNRSNYDSYILPNCIELSPYWIIGFVEGDGCFTINKMKAHLYLVQKNDKILNVIRDFFLMLIKKNEDLDLTLLNGIENKENNNNYLPCVRKKNNVNPVFCFSISNQDIIYKYIVPFFAKRKLLTRKGYDFYIWLICIYIIFFGYSKLKEGKIVLLQLSKNMNNKRYSKFDLSQGKYVYTLPFDYSALFNSLKSLFNMKPVFDLTIKDKSHKELSDAYTRNELNNSPRKKKGHLVFAYKGLSFINNFPSIKETSKTLNVPISNISNYIDTGLEIKGYCFFSYKK
jgi:NADH dehydrogenase/LAGLIDADG endonuclease/Type II intron maturase